MAKRMMVSFVLGALDGASIAAAFAEAQLPLPLARRLEATVSKENLFAVETTTITVGS